MTLTIIKNGTRDFTHVTEFANMTFGYYSMVLNNTLQTVVIKMPNGAQFPNDAIGIVDVFFQDNTDTGDIESFATTELLKARLIEVDYNGLVEASGGGSGAVDSVFTRTGVVTAQSGDYNTGLVTEVTDKKYVTDTQLTKISAIDQSVSSVEKATWNGKQDALTATDYSAISTIVGFSTIDTKYLMIQDFAGLMIINYQISGTSNATNFTFTIPHSVPTQQFRNAYVRNNGTFVTSTALIQGSGTTVTIFNGTSTFTASGTKSAYGTIILFK